MFYLSVVTSHMHEDKMRERHPRGTVSGDGKREELRNGRWGWISEWLFTSEE